MFNNYLIVVQVSIEREKAVKMRLSVGIDGGWVTGASRTDLRALRGLLAPS